MRFFFPRHVPFLLLFLFAAFCQMPCLAQEEIPDLRDAAPDTVVAVPIQAPQNVLLFCNTPEKIRMGGAVADAHLLAGTTYTIFYHYRNVSQNGGEFVVALHNTESGPLRFTARKGMADPQRDPPLAGRQAMARFLQAGENVFTGKHGTARFGHLLKNKQVASGILSIKCEKTARLRIYFRHDKYTVPGAGVVAVADPHKQIEVALSQTSRTCYYRIGLPDAGSDRRLDGTYGMLYAFKVAAPAGRRVRVLFSPRGGKAGMVGSIGGKMTQSGIVGAAQWAIFCETTVGKDGMVLTTAPFGGVFYPVELLFQLI